MEGEDKTYIQALSGGHESKPITPQNRQRLAYWDSYIENVDNAQLIANIPHVIKITL